MKKEIVFIMSYPWFSLYQRPNHFARIFKQNGYGVQVIEFRQIIRLNSILNRMKFGEHRRDIDKLRSVVKLPFVHLENVQLASKIRKILSEKKPDTELIFWFQGFDDAIDYSRILPLLTGRTILDVSDSFPDFFTDVKMRQRLEAAERQLSQKADVVFTTAQVLYDKFRAYNPRTYLIRNGVDVSRYRSITRPPDSALSEKIEAIGASKVVGYQGSISSWVDFDLLEGVISKTPELSFLFVGMVDVRARRDFRRLCRRHNFHYLGAVSPDALPWVLSKIDVGIIPFQINDLIRATNPIKLYEYLAAGKPVVATPMPEVMRYEAKAIVATAADPETFAASLREMAAFSADPAARAMRLKIADENSWESRFKNILEYVPEIS
ncbi:MAG: glycosyltransferase [Thermodesulfovibrionales bacterium]